MSNGKPSLWVFTTSSKPAQRNKGKSLSNPISTSILENHLPLERLEELRSESEDGNLYAWGSVPGPDNIDNWKEMEPGDYVLTYQEKGYIYWSRVISTLHSKDLASEIWEPKESGEVFEYMYFLQPPQDIDVAVEDVDDVIESKKYQGFSPVGGEHIERMRDQCGSIRDFLKERMGNPTSMSNLPKEDPPTDKQDLPSEIESCLSLLEEKPQLIFSGPPGTSKTYGAFELISAIKGTYDPAENPRRNVASNRFKGDPDEPPVGPVVWDIVQFHQSYGYEDFVSGIDAQAEGELTFDRKDRIFLQLVEAARKRDVPHVLIIDEINRGALGRVFGELILTLEYRDLPVRLPGQKKQIRVPENLFLIGTMNTADRNVSRIDHALRRRFNFVKRLPDKKRLKSYLSQTQISEEEAILGAFDGVRQAFTTEESSPGKNVEYAEDARGYTLEDYAVGHTYFMVDSIQQLGRRLNRQVIPLLREYKKEGILSKQRLERAASGLQDAFGSQIPEEVDRWCGRRQ
jgi:MoxR-like ATPase